MRREHTVESILVELTEGLDFFRLGLVLYFMIVLLLLYRVLVVRL